MKIEFVNQYGVIAGLNATDLPPFAVLIGPNGAGKSHVFRALINYGLDQDAPLSLAIPGITKEGIQLYEPNSFRSHSSQQANRQTSEQVRGLTDAFFLHGPEGGTLRDLSAKVFDEAVKSLDDIEAQATFVDGLKDEIHRIPRQGVFGLNGNNAYTTEIRSRILGELSNSELQRRRNAGENRLNRLSVEDSRYCQLLSAAMKKISKFPHELTREDISGALHYDEHLLSNRLSEIFSAYKLAQYAWAHRQIEVSGAPTYAELIQQYQEDLPPPWQVMREVLAEIREAAGDYALFDFDFTDPEGQELNMENFELYTFKAEMTNRTTGATYELHDLSSGEQILMALCMVSFNQIIGRRPPQLLLLDEIDAMLHPSMVKALVGTLKTLFVENGVPVLMTSHSPMTVATLDDNEVFRVSRTGYHVEISPVTKADAISELSEGLATVDMGLRIAAYRESKITILTEGNNVKHLKRWAELYYPEDVRVFEGIEGESGRSDLLTYGRLLSKINLNTYFVIVWDCDATRDASTLQSELTTGAGITPFAFTQRPENQIAKRGIENNYEESVLEPYSTETRDSSGSLISRGFNGKRKTEFANHILANGTREHFTHFQGLNDVVNGILRGMAIGRADTQSLSAEFSQTNTI